LTNNYVHQELNQQVTAIGGHYVLVKEARLPFLGREVLYLVGHAAFDTTCCGTGGCATASTRGGAYALVPGFIVSWKSGTNEDGLAVSAVQPVHQPDVQEQIRRLLERQERIHQVIFQ
jgi:hypothetical protein